MMLEAITRSRRPVRHRNEANVVASGDSFSKSGFLELEMEPRPAMKGNGFKFSRM
jgi:hypothetical protein